MQRASLFLEKFPALGVFHYMSEKEKNRTNSLGDLFPIEKSDFYQSYLAEKEEIEKLKWLLSEKLGRDCGYEYARWIWVYKHRENWIKAKTSSGVH